MCVPVVLQFFYVAAFDIEDSFGEGVHEGESYAYINAALHVELLVFLFQPHVSKVGT